MDGSHPAAALPAAPADESYAYLQAVARCGDQRPLLVSQPIYSANGIKLLDGGAKVDSRVLDRLLGHSLAEPIDRCLTSPEAVRHKDIETRMQELVEATPLLAHFNQTAAVQDGCARRLWASLAACPLPPAIAMRLTVIRETEPRLYEHLLRAAFCALFIGSSARFSETALQNLATAALLHDAGMFYADPVSFPEDGPLDLTARRSLLAHPLAAEIIARGEAGLSPIVATAIAQHHERLDGSGYPRGLHGEAICSLARVLMLAEVALAVAEHPQVDAALQLSLILRLNHRCFDAELSALVLGALPPMHPEQMNWPKARETCKQALARVDAWLSLRESAAGAGDDPAAAFIERRVLQLRRWLVEAGLAGFPPAAASADDSAELNAELDVLSRETLWHLRQISYDALLRWPQLATEPAASATAAGCWIAMNLAPGKGES